MRLSALLVSVVCGVLIGDNAVVRAGSFNHDVVAKVAKKVRRQKEQQNVEDELLQMAIPIEEYNRQLRELGVDIPTAAASEGATEKFQRMLDGEDGAEDDYYMNENYMYSFSGYSLKYAKCQPIQQFSADALAAGEYSPMVTQDIVILRLCPYKSCSDSRQYGCHYNYAEYAIGLNDYIRIMLRYKAAKKEKLCEFCGGCMNRRNLEENENGENENNGENQQENGNNENQQNNQQNDNNNNGNQAQADDYYGADDDGGNNNYNYYNNDDDGNNNFQYYYNEGDDCYTYGAYCEGYYQDCANGDDDAQQYNYQDDYAQNMADKTLEEDEYYDYLGCTEIADDYGGIYFVRPSCESTSSGSKITMTIFYDQYCSQSASSAVNMDNFEVRFDESVFYELYEGSCIDCSESNYPPGFNANSYMCNKIHDVAADCTTNMVYDLFDGQSSDSTECSFIESIRFGTYDNNGQIAQEATEGAEEVVTDLQKIGLAASAFICTLFVVYACYLHHSMTNLLIKSLSHRELLPPGRHSKRRSPSKTKRRRSKGSKGSRRSDEEDSDEYSGNRQLRSPV